MEQDFSGCEITEIAVRIEENGKLFYQDLAKKAVSEDAERTMLYLAGEEEKHKMFFRNIFRESCSYEPEAAYPEEYFSYMRTLASSFLFSDRERTLELVEGILSFEEGIDLGIQLEKDSVLFYEEMIRKVPEKDREKLGKIIAEEKLHLSKLCSMKGEGNGECQSI